MDQTACERWLIFKSFFSGLAIAWYQTSSKARTSRGNLESFSEILSLPCSRMRHSTEQKTRLKVFEIFSRIHYRTIHRMRNNVKLFLWLAMYEIPSSTPFGSPQLESKPLSQTWQMGPRLQACQFLPFDKKLPFLTNYQERRSFPWSLVIFL